MQHSTVGNQLLTHESQLVGITERQIIDLYLQDLTQEEISDKISLSRSRVSEIVEKFKTEFSDKAPESLQLFNVWSFGKRDEKYGLANF